MKRLRLLLVWGVLSALLAGGLLVAGSGTGPNEMERCLDVQHAGTDSLQTRELSWPARVECRFIDSRGGGGTRVTTRTLRPPPSIIAWVFLGSGVGVGATIAFALGARAVWTRLGARRAAPG